MTNIQTELISSLIFSLPGQGVPKDTCHEYTSKAHLDYDSNEWHYQPHLNDCGRFECPVCPGWIQGEAASIMDRLLAWKSMTHREIIHVIVSPRPTAIFTPSYYRSLRRTAYKMGKKSGLRGGVWIFHYFRHPSGMNDRTEICPDNPHWHVLGDGWIVGIRPTPGWIVKRIGIRRSNAQIRSTINYCLKWASQGNSLIGDSSPAKKGSIEIETWTGVMSLKALKVPKFVGEGLKCLTCEQIIPYKDWYNVVWLHGDPPDIDTKNGVLDPSEADISIPFYYR